MVARTENDRQKTNRKEIRPTALISLAITLTISLSGCGSGEVTGTQFTTSIVPQTGTALLEVPAEAESTTTIGWQSHWVSIRYRDDPVDVGAPWFETLHADSSLIRAAWFDAENGYLVIDLQGTVYHYCGMPVSIWQVLVAATSQGSYFNQSIKASYDCRSNLVPEYG